MRSLVVRTCAAILVSLVLAGCTRSPEARRDGFMAKGKALMQQKEYSRAMLEFRNALQATPNDAEPYYQLGLAASAANDVNTAALTLRRATELNPNHIGAQLKLAQLIALVGDDELLKDTHARLKELAAIVIDR